MSALCILLFIGSKEGVSVVYRAGCLLIWQGPHSRCYYLDCFPIVRSRNGKLYPVINLKFYRKRKMKINMPTKHMLTLPRKILDPGSILLIENFQSFSRHHSFVALQLESVVVVRNDAARTTRLMIVLLPYLHIFHLPLDVVERV